MANSGTLLSDLDSKGSAPNDQDLVRKIFAEMDTQGGGGSPQNPILSGGGMIPMINSPNPNTVAPITMDAAPPTSHLIGKDHPTPADFAAAMHGVQRPPEAQMAPMAGNWGQFAGAAAGAPPPMPAALPEPPKKNIYSRIAEELKTPILVALLLFIFSLPAINILFSHYVPSLVKASGDLTSVGLLVKSLLAGATFWTLQRVVAPLVAL